MAGDVDPERDLTFERVVPVDVEHLWRGWTDPAVMVRWFCPAPWVTTEAEVDPTPGGIFRTVMESPEGIRQEGVGCVLVAEHPNLLVWTNALGPEFRPQEVGAPGFAFIATLEFEQLDEGARYRATVCHASAEGAQEHRELGFHEGWNAALDQLLALDVGADAIDGP